MEKAAEAEYRAAEIELAYNVRKTYFSFLQAGEMLKAAQEELALVGEQVRTTEIRYDAETVPRSEVLRAQAELQAVKAKLVKAETDVQLAGTALNMLLGRNLDVEIELPVSVDSISGSGISMMEAMTMALGKRPEFRKLKAMKNAVRAQNLPAIALVFDYGIQGEKYRFDHDADYYMLSGVLSWNLFDGFSSRARREKVALSIRQVQARRKWLEQAVAQDVTRAYLTVQGKAEEHKAAVKGLEASREGFRMVEKTYDEGICSQLELMDARTALTEASALEVASRYAFLSALADLHRSLGIMTK